MFGSRYETDPSAFGGAVDGKPKKKYELSLKKSKEAMNKQAKRQNNVQQSPIMNNRPETADSSDSQNFMLRLSASFLVEDTQEISGRKNVAETEVILISDSSDEETSRGPEGQRFEGFKSLPINDKASRRTVYVPGSSESENDEEKVEKSTSPRNFASVNAAQRKCSIMYTSDETASDADLTDISNNKENHYVTNRRKSSSPKKIIDDSEDFMFTFDKMKSVLTDNRQNRTPVSGKIAREQSKSIEKASRQLEELRRTPTGSHRRNEEPGSAKSGHETMRKIDESRRTPTENFFMNAKNSAKSPKDRRIEDSRDRATPSALRSVEKSPLRPKTREIRDENRTPTNFFPKENDWGSGKNVKETPENEKTPKTRPESGKNLKESRNEFHTPKVDPKNNAKTSTILSSGKSRVTTVRRAEVTPAASENSAHKNVLRKKDVKTIFKVIKSQRAVWDSPGRWKRRERSTTSEESSDNEEPNSPDSDLLKPQNPQIIEETDSESESENVIRGSRVDLSKPHKSHVSRFFDTAGGNFSSPEGLSEKKKLEIANWLMMNPEDARSESSMSHVPPSDRNSTSSGNSSLERLEMNYETPNNRERMRKLNSDKKSAKNHVDSSKSRVNTPKTPKTVIQRQTTIDTYIRKNHDGSQQIFTPIAPATKAKNPVSSTGQIAGNLDIDDCADFLDDLYGDAWRPKAKELFPMTEPRKKNVVLRDKAVQTERKVPREKKITRNSGDSVDMDFDNFVKNMPNLNSTKKPPVKARPKDSFIKDSSSSGESPETTYLTAMTTPRISNTRTANQQTPLPLSVQRAIAICDSDTDDENDADNKKVLTYSDEENSESSEYDPNDILPPKTTRKYRRDPSPVAKKATSAKSCNPTENAKNTFLSSLSAAVPIAEAHADAKKYRADFKKTKEELCKHLFKLYNEKIFDNRLPSDMLIEWNARMRGTAGFCYNKRTVKALGGVTRSSRIVLATKILDTPDRLRDTLVHEMCHAAAWLINEISDGHGPFWKGWVSKAMKAFPELPTIKRCHDYKITTKFTYRCTGCGYSIGRHSKSLDVKKKCCGHCFGKFELLINKVSKNGSVEMKTPTTKKPSAFALFVKENYSSVKKNRLPHKEVMQILGQQFSAVKITKQGSDDDKKNDDDALSH